MFVKSCGQACIGACSKYAGDQFGASQQIAQAKNQFFQFGHTWQMESALKFVNIGFVKNLTKSCIF